MARHKRKLSRETWARLKGGCSLLNLSLGPAEGGTKLLNLSLGPAEGGTSGREK